MHPWLQHYTPGARNRGIPLPYRCIPELVSRSARRFGARTAFTTCMANGMNGSLSFAQVEEMSGAFAVYLREHLRLLPGSRVAVQIPNCLAYPVVAFGIFKANCVLVRVNPLYTSSRWQRIVGCPIAEGYGLTESSPVLCFNPLDNPSQDSIGIPVPGTDIRILDDNGDPVPPGQNGELIARGPQVSTGYRNRPGETRRTFRDGWLYTGDMAYMDESAVAGIPDERTGEAVQAFVWLRNKSLGAGAHGAR